MPRIVEIAHFPKDKDGKVTKTSLELDWVDPKLDENNYVKNGVAFLTLKEGKEKKGTFSLSLSELLELSCAIDFIGRKNFSVVSKLESERYLKWKNSDNVNPNLKVKEVDETD